MQGVGAYEGNFQVNLLKRNTLIQVWLCFPNKIFQYNSKIQTAKACKGFDPQPNLEGLSAPKTAGDWPTQQSCFLISPVFDL